MFKKLNNWLSEHAFVWPWEGNAGVAHLWAMFVTIILTFVWHYAGFNWQYLWQGLAGIVTFGLPIIAGIKALVTKTKWNPWYWFPCAIGFVFGGLIMFIVALVFWGYSL
jgi:hypothetical protein